MPDEASEERHFLLLKEHLELGEDVFVEKSESPDFLFRNSGRIIGVEHTEIFLDKEYPLQAIESVEDKILSFAEKYADRNEYIPARTKILFGDVRGIKAKQREVLAANIADYVQEHLLASKKNDFEQIRLESSFKEVKAIYATVMPRGFENHYFAPRAGWVKPDATKELSDSILRKSKKLESCRSKCDEAWLLIVADGRNPSSLLGKGGGVQPVKSLHGFDRVFFMFYITKYVQEVNIL